MDKANLSAIRETFGKVVYTHKTHEKAAEICSSKNKCFKRINVFLLALTTGSALGSIIKGEAFILHSAICGPLILNFLMAQIYQIFLEI